MNFLIQSHPLPDVLINLRPITIQMQQLTMGAVFLRPSQLAHQTLMLTK
jgi:hypothetical protein